MKFRLRKVVGKEKKRRRLRIPTRQREFLLDFLLDFSYRPADERLDCVASNFIVRGLVVGERQWVSMGKHRGFSVEFGAEFSSEFGIEFGIEFLVLRRGILVNVPMGLNLMLGKQCSAIQRLGVAADERLVSIRDAQTYLVTP